jgi:creatinine amidohydrolase/Fe(II)-dependent formamide hydrolase-like protein
MFWLCPKTFHNLLLDVYEAMRRWGFQAIVVISGHWSIEHNIAAIRATGEEFRRAHPTTGWLLLTNQEVVPDRHYPVEHTAGGETSLLLAIHPELVALDKTFESDRSLRSNYAEELGQLRRRSESPHKYIGVNPAVADLSNDPEGATVKRGRALLETIVERVAARARTLLAETTSGDQ